MKHNEKFNITKIQTFSNVNFIIVLHSLSISNHNDVHKIIVILHT